jgi:hypothetical protein
MNNENNILVRIKNTNLEGSYKDNIKLMDAQLSINEDALPRHNVHRQSYPISESSRFGTLCRDVQDDLLRLSLAPAERVSLP